MLIITDFSLQKIITFIIIIMIIFMIIIAIRAIAGIWRERKGSGLFTANN
jgi:large-conductance mechanosensitive channel